MDMPNSCSECNRQIQCQMLVNEAKAKNNIMLAVTALNLCPVAINDMKGKSK